MTREVKEVNVPVTDKEACMRLVDGVMRYSSISIFDREIQTDFEWTGSMDNCRTTENKCRDLFKDPWVLLQARLNGFTGSVDDLIQYRKKQLFDKWRKENPEYVPPDKSNISLAAKVASNWWAYQLYPSTKNDYIPVDKKERFRNFVYNAVIINLSDWRTKYVSFELNPYTTRGTGEIVFDEKRLSSLNIKSQWLPDYYIFMQVSRSNIWIRYSDPVREDDSLELPKFDWPRDHR